MQADDVFDEADAVVIGTEWTQFAALDWPALRSRVREPIIIDGRRLLDREAVERAGFRLTTLGRGDRSR
jgi:UDPglucose 6-dehydrogenase